MQDGGEGVGTPSHMSMWLQEMDTDRKKGGPIVKVKKRFDDLLYRQMQHKIINEKVCKISVPEIAAILDKALQEVALTPEAPGEEPGELFINSMKVRARAPSPVFNVFG